MDVDESGEVEFDEFVGLMYGIRRGRISPLRFLLAAFCGCDSRPAGSAARSWFQRLLPFGSSKEVQVEPEEETEEDLQNEALEYKSNQGALEESKSEPENGEAVGMLGLEDGS